MRSVYEIDVEGFGTLLVRVFDEGAELGGLNLDGDEAFCWTLSQEETDELARAAHLAAGRGELD